MKFVFECFFVASVLSIFIRCSIKNNLCRCPVQCNVDYLQLPKWFIWCNVNQQQHTKANGKIRMKIWWCHRFTEKIELHKPFTKMHIQGNSEKIAHFGLRQIIWLFVLLHINWKGLRSFKNLVLNRLSIIFESPCLYCNC